MSEQEPLYDGAELVVYTSELEDLEEYTDEEREMLREWQEETGLNSVSLWARWDEREIPIYNLAPSGSWFSLATEIHQNVSDSHVSDAFVRVCADPWNVEESDWEELTDAEAIICNRLRHSIIMGEPIPEQIEICEWCKKRNNE